MPDESSKMRKQIFSSRGVPFALLILCFLSFGLLISKLGFYQDDWVVIWFAKAFGPGVFIDFFANERPFYAGVYMLTTSLMGSSQLAWQIFGIMTRWLAVLAAWWTLRQLWPRHTIQATWVAFIFAIYPSFKQQSASVVHSQNFILLASAILSLGLMVLAVRKRRWSVHLTILAMLTGGFSMFSAEYFFGLELLRPLFLWLALEHETPSLGHRLRRTLARWMPYLVIMGLFLGWRLFIFRFPTYDPDLVQGLINDPRATLIVLGQTIIQDAFDVMVFAWVETLEFVRSVQEGITPVARRWGVILLGAMASGIYLYGFKEQAAASQTPDHDPDVSEQPSNQAFGPPPLDEDDLSPDIQHKWSLQAILVGGYSLVVMGWPYWFAGLPIELYISNDRFTVVFIFGASILLVGTLDLLVKTRLQKTILLSIMIGLAIGHHVEIERSFSQVSQAQEKMFRQMVWRAPGLKPDTLILTDNLPFPYSWASSLVAPFNWIYTNQYDYPHLQYQFMYVSEKLGNELPDIAPGLKVEKNLRTMNFVGSTTDTIVFYYEPPGCLQILDPDIHSSLPRIPEAIQNAAAISNLERIESDGEIPQQRINEIFGSQDETGWCYYFEKADLARQTGEWDQIVQLGDEAFERGLAPEFKFEREYLPFIQGYAYTRRWQQAYKLSHDALGPVPAMSASICTLWDRIRQETPPSHERSEVLQELSNDLDCLAP
jgi:hypothetical protein